MELFSVALDISSTKAETFAPLISLNAQAL